MYHAVIETTIAMGKGGPIEGGLCGGKGAKDRVRNERYEVIFRRDTRSGFQNMSFPTSCVCSSFPLLSKHA